MTEYGKVFFSRPTIDDLVTDIALDTQSEFASGGRGDYFHIVITCRLGR